MGDSLKWSFTTQVCLVEVDITAAAAFTAQLKTTFERWSFCHHLGLPTFPGGTVESPAALLLGSILDKCIGDTGKAPHYECCYRAMRHGESKTLSLGEQLQAAYHRKGSPVGDLPGTITAVSDDDPAHVVHFKNTFAALTKCKEGTNVRFLKIATALDPRFKNMKCLPNLKGTRCGACFQKS
ncbi:unnamed protein product [Caretta caretta]